MSYTKIIIRKPIWIQMVLFGIMYGSMAELGRILSVKAFNFPVFWPASGLFVAVLILTELRGWKYFIIAAWVINFIYGVYHGNSLCVSLFVSFGNCIEAFCGAWLIQTCISNGIVVTPLKDVLGLSIFSSLLSTTISATIGAAAITSCDHVKSFWEIWSLWWLSHMIGIIGAAPFFLYWMNPTILNLKTIPWKRIPEALGMIISILFCSWSIFSEYCKWINIDYYLLIPLLVWASLRFQEQGVSLAGFIVTIVAFGYASTSQRELFLQHIPVLHQILSLQVFLGIILFTIQVLTAVLSERKQMESALRVSEKKYRTLFDNAPDGIEMLDPQGYIIQCNTAFEQFVNYHHSEIIGKHTSQFFSDESKKIIKEKLVQVRQQGFSESEVNLVTREGKIIEIWRKSKALYDDTNTCTGIVVYNRNISLRKKAERELNALIVAMPAYVLIARDPDCHEIFGSKNINAFRKLSNMPPLSESSDSKQLFPFIRLFENGWDMPSLKMPLQLAASTGNDFRDFELVIVFESGEKRTLLGNATPLKDETNKVIGSVAVFIDISDRKQIEDALRENEERITLALKGTDVGIWDWNLSDGTILFDEHWADILGIDPLTKTVDVKWLHNRMAPKGINDFNTIYQTYLEKNAPFFELECQIKNKEDQWKWIWTRGKVIEYHKKAKPYRMIGVLRDITERKRNEEIIQASLREKEILLREIHHRVKNNMQVISSLLKLQALKVKDNRMLHALKDSENRIRTMSLVHETLYRSDTFGSINFQTYLTTLAKSIYQSYADPLKRLDIQIDVTGIHISIEYATTIGLLINELLTNSFKYAFIDRSDGKIIITARALPDNFIELIVKDNGVGIPKDFDWRNTESLGLQLVVTLAEHQLDGSIELDTSNGTQFTIRFKNIDIQKGSYDDK